MAEETGLPIVRAAMGKKGKSITGELLDSIGLGQLKLREKAAEAISNR